MHYNHCHRVTAHLQFIIIIIIIIVIIIIINWAWILEYLQTVISEYWYT
jgi:hypothetical protein